MAMKSNTTHILVNAFVGLLLSIGLVQAPIAAGTSGGVSYKTVTIDGLDIFYREAGPDGAPVILLLHGYPTSSHMFRNLIRDLSDQYHLLAPDYPGFEEASSRPCLSLITRSTTFQKS
jgi:hypothetical protein